MSSLALPKLDTWVIVALAIVAGVAIGLVATYVVRLYRHRRERLQRRRRIEAVSVDHLRDVSVPDGSGGVLHIDYLLLTARGLLILDLRDVAGNVFGSDPMTEWTVMQGPRRFTFANPQGAMYDRIAALKLLVEDVPVDGRVVFGRSAAFPKGMPRMTLREDSLESEFPLGDRAQASQLVDTWRPVWERLRAELAPSEFSTRR